MNQQKNLLTGLLWSSLLLLLILDSRTALTAASEGIQLCLKTLIPSVFPFIFIGGLLCAAIRTIRCPLMEKLLRIPPYSIGYFLTGLICGYPVGAKTLQDAYRSGQIDRATASRMCCFCNNAGPAFIIGVLSSVFSSWEVSLIIWMIQILSAVITGILIPNSTDADFRVQSTPGINMHLQMRHTLSAVASICGWVILFKVILSYMDIWIMPSIPKLTQCLLAGFLELANGLCMLSMIESNALRLIVATAMLSFGGICIYFQTKSVAPDLVTLHPMQNTAKLDRDRYVNGCKLFFLWPGATDFNCLSPAHHRYGHSCFAFVF